MSRIFGAVCQNGYVVRDIRAAMDHWINAVGVGFFERVRQAAVNWDGADPIRDVRSR